MRGLRWGEVAGLRVRSIDLLRRSVTVSEAVARDGHGRTILDDPKSEASRRNQAAPQALLDLLAAHIAAQGFTGDSQAFLFSQGDGQPLDYGNFHKRHWLPAVAQVGLPGPTSGRQRFYGFHDLRRANASEMADATDARTAQSRMGHSDIRLTLQVYAQRSTVADRAAGDALGEHFFSGSRDGRGMEPPLGAAVGDGTTPTRDFSEPESGFEPLTYALRGPNDGCTTNLGESERLVGNEMQTLAHPGEPQRTREESAMVCDILTGHPIVDSLAETTAARRLGRVLEGSFSEVRALRKPRR